MFNNKVFVPQICITTHPDTVLTLFESNAKMSPPLTYLQKWRQVLQLLLKCVYGRSVVVST